MQLGRFTLREVVTGSLVLDGGALFGMVPRALWSRDLPPDDQNRVRIVTRSLLVEAGNRRVLVDAGPGRRFSDKERSIYALAPDTDTVAALERLGVAPETITDVVVTHLHWDHAGGLSLESNGGCRLAFPKAVHHVQRRNWKWAHAPSERDRRMYRPEDFELLEACGRVHFIEGETELFDGLHLLTCEGHTVGQQIVRIAADEGTVLFCGDTIPTAAHMPPAWSLGYDLYPLTLVEEKKQLLAQALEEGWILFFPHDPRFAACTVREDGGRVVVDEVVPF